MLIRLFSAMYKNSIYKGNKTLEGRMTFDSGG
jgi:hypothetical protein